MWVCGIILCSVSVRVHVRRVSLEPGTPLMVIVLSCKKTADSAAVGLIFSIAAVSVGALLK